MTRTNVVCLQLLCLSDSFDNFSVDNVRQRGGFKEPALHYELYGGLFSIDSQNTSLVKVPEQFVLFACALQRGECRPRKGLTHMLCQGKAVVASGC